MSVLALLAHHWRRHRLALLWLSAANALFQWAITRVVPDASQTAFVRDLFAMVPAPVRVLFGEELMANLTAGGFLAFSYVHPFPLLIFSAWAVRVATGALAGEVGRGTMDLIAARPVSRGAQVTAAAITIGAGLTFLAAAEWCGTAAGLRARVLEDVAAAQYLPLAAMSLLLFAAFGAIALLVSALRSDGGSAISWCAGILAGSYVTEYLARVWPAIGFLRPFTLFRYFEPQRILRDGGASTLDVTVLAGAGAAALLLAFVAFGRRDL